MLRRTPCSWRVLLLLLLVSSLGWSTQIYQFAETGTPTGGAGSTPVPVDVKAQVTVYSDSTNSVHILVELINAYNQNTKQSEAANINGFGMKFGNFQVVDLTGYQLTSYATYRTFYQNNPGACLLGGNGGSSNPYYCNTGAGATDWQMNTGAQLAAITPYNATVNPIDVYLNDPLTPSWGQNKNMVVFQPNGGGTSYNVNGNQYDNSQFNPFYLTQSTSFNTGTNPWWDIKLSKANNPNIDAETLQIVNALFTFGSNSAIQGNGTLTKYEFTTPEVSTYLSFGSGLILLGLVSWRHRKQKQPTA